MKVFGVFMPYHKNEILDSCYEGYDELPSYPREYRRVRVFTDKLTKTVSRKPTALVVG